MENFFENPTFHFNVEGTLEPFYFVDVTNNGSMVFNHHNCDGKVYLTRNVLKMVLLHPEIKLRITKVHKPSRHGGDMILYFLE